MKKIVSLLFFVSSILSAQEKYSFYVICKDYEQFPKFELSRGYLKYIGEDIEYRNFFGQFRFTKFHQAFPMFNNKENLNVYLLETETYEMPELLINNFPDFFTYYENTNLTLPELSYYPNDFGLTNPNGNNGILINRDDLDYINTPEAWNHQTGSGFIVGVSDAQININDPDFINKTTLINQNFNNIPYDPENLNTFHGTNVAGILAARGDNSYGSLGVCYDCNIYSTSYQGGFGNIKILADMGVRVFNMSWNNFNVFSPWVNNQIQEILQNEYVILVGSAGNRSSHQTNTDFFDGNFNNFTGNYVPTYTGEQIGYPASYPGVISVSSVGHRFFPNDPDCIDSISPFGFPIGINVKDSFSNNVNVSDPNNPIGLLFNGWPRTRERPDGTIQIISPNGIVNTHTYNEFVDILAPTFGTFSFSKFIDEGQISYINQATSGAAPKVTGTIALMLAENECLTRREVESIIKMMSKDVTSGSINSNFAGKIGAGVLDVGKSVIFSKEIKKPNGNAIFENHSFNRFEFIVNNINNNLLIKNIILEESNKTFLKAKNQITVVDSHFNPNAFGSIHLKLDESISTSCSINYRKANVEISSINNEKPLKSYIFPNPIYNNKEFNIYLANYNNDLVDISIFDVNGKILLNKKKMQVNNNIIKIDGEFLKSGLYFVEINKYDEKETIKLLVN